MKLLSQLITIGGLWLSHAIASPLTSPVSPAVDSKLIKRDDAACSNPGEYMCGLIIAVAVFDWPGAQEVATEQINVHIVNGNCDSILEGDNSLSGDGNGFDKVFQTTYGTQLQLWANDIGVDDFQNVNFLYNNQDWHYQSECFQGSNGLDPAWSTLQCNFAC
ncbi:hypothetical protein SEPCBS119000_006128 [Sporothrix epigloea]|uniref:Uncharacterized protein n=1 Tax=Sporothrix epigloea TaxID=1892477 RepID=A0ABP0E5I1_9PEZI